MLDNLQSLLEEQIKDLYSAENQLLKALPKMAKAASSETLREAFQSHLEETRGHVERLQEIAAVLEIKPGGKKCKAMEGLVEEGSEVLEEEGNGATIDAALIAAAQRVEHYEISAYGSARTLAEVLDMSNIVELLQKTLQEEETCDEKLNEICEQEILPAAPKSEQDGETESAESQGRGRNGSVGSKKPGAERNGKSSGKGGSSNSRTSRELSRR